MANFQKRPLIYMPNKTRNVGGGSSPSPTPPSPSIPSEIYGLIDRNALVRCPYNGDNIVGKSIMSGGYVPNNEIYKTKPFYINGNYGGFRSSTNVLRIEMLAPQYASNVLSSVFWYGSVLGSGSFQLVCSTLTSIGNNEAYSVYMNGSQTHNMGGRSFNLNGTSATDNVTVLAYQFTTSVISDIVTALNNVPNFGAHSYVFILEGGTPISDADILVILNAVSNNPNAYTNIITIQ